MRLSCGLATIRVVIVYFVKNIEDIRIGCDGVIVILQLSE